MKRPTNWLFIAVAVAVAVIAVVVLPKPGVLSWIGGVP